MILRQRVTLVSLVEKLKQLYTGYQLSIVFLLKLDYMTAFTRLWKMKMVQLILNSMKIHYKY